MKKITLFLTILGFAIPFLLIYKSFFQPAVLSWGDAPYFYPEGLKELFNIPFSWSYRGGNFGTPQQDILWLYLPTFLVGFLNYLSGLGNDILLRIVFYFPSTILSIIGSYLFIRQYTSSKLSIFLGSIFYGFNNYFLMIVDGGQIGVALAYGVFPFMLLALEKYFNKSNLRNFILAVILLTLITNIDLRIAVLSLLTFLTLKVIGVLVSRNLIQVIKLINLIPVLLAVIFLDAFWVLPMVDAVKNSNGTLIQYTASSLNLISLVNALYLFNPHFPLNEFGKMQDLPVYFGLLPILILGVLAFRRDKITLSLSLSLLIFIFLSKGGAEPLGGGYQWFIQTIPLAAAFRDSSKFMIPSILFSGVLLALTFNVASVRFEKQKILLAFFAYLYLLVLIWPGLLGNLTGVLGGHPLSNDYQVIAEKIQNDGNFFRTLWFPELSSLAPSYQGKEALSANLLYQEKPFASMIKGDYDLFYFLHDDMVTDWFQLLGIKYAFLPLDQRKKEWTMKDLKERNAFLEFVVKQPNFKQLSWPVSFPVYKFDHTKPKIFAQDKIIIVSGGTDIYRYLKSNIKNFSLSSQGFVFLEDGLFNPSDLNNLPQDSALLVVEGKDDLDLAMSFLQSYFLGSKNITETKWGDFKSSDFIKWRYELLKHGIDSTDLDFSKDVNYSSIKGEKINYQVKIDSPGNYYLAFRNVSSASAGLKVDFDSSQKFIIPVSGDRFRWNLIGPVNLSSGMKQIDLENLDGFQAINSVAVFPESSLSKASEQAQQLRNRLPVFSIDNQKDLNRLKNVLSNVNSAEVKYKEINPTEYRIDSPINHNWLVFSDHFNNGWKLDNSAPMPLYSMINGFFIGDKTKKDLILKYEPQEKVKTGLLISEVNLLILIIASAVVFLRRR